MNNPKSSLHEIDEIDRLVANVIAQNFQVVAEIESVFSLGIGRILARSDGVNTRAMLMRSVAGAVAMGSVLLRGDHSQHVTRSLPLAILTRSRQIPDYQGPNRCRYSAELTKPLTIVR